MSEGFKEPVSIEVLRSLVRYEPETGLFFWLERTPENCKNHQTWNLQYAGRRAGRLDGYGYLKFTLNYKGCLAHRAAWAHYHGEWPKICIDHINGDKTDNRLANLRLATNRENNRNIRNPRSNMSGVVGVSKAGNRWQATIKVDKRDVHLGTFGTIEEAAEARKAAVERYGFHPNHGIKRVVVEEPPAEPVGPAHDIALRSLCWTENPHLVEAAAALHRDGYNNAKGHLSGYMAGRFLDAYQAASLALAAMPAVDGEVEPIVARLNSFTTCGCGDDDWPLLRHDTVHLIDRLKAPATPEVEL